MSSWEGYYQGGGHLTVPGHPFLKKVTNEVLYISYDYMGDRPVLVEITRDGRTWTMSYDEFLGEELKKLDIPEEEKVSILKLMRNKDPELRELFFLLCEENGIK